MVRISSPNVFKAPAKLIELGIAMTERLQIYKCEICGNIVEVLHSGEGQLVCCGQPMTLLKEQREEQGREKHVPVIERTDKGIKIKVGSIPHPMEDKHYIEWIEAITDDKTLLKFLKPGDKPEAEFEVKDRNVRARDYCNVHGLWSMGK